MNLLIETIEKLKEHGKSTEDVTWVGSIEYGYISWKEFSEISNFEYYAGYGSSEVAHDLLIVGEGWYLDRSEYDGAEGWKFNEVPEKPKYNGNIKLLAGGMWKSLSEINTKEKR